MRCSNCGSDIAEGQKFCVNCGAPVTEVSQDIDETAQVEEADSVAQEPETEEMQLEETQPEIQAEDVVQEPETEEMQAEEAQPETQQEQSEQSGAECEKTEQPEQTAAGVAAGAAPAAYSTARSADAIIASIPAEYKPLSLWQYFGLDILFDLPIIGVIASLIFSLDASKNMNLTNFARARFLWTVIETMLALLTFVMVIVKLL